MLHSELLAKAPNKYDLVLRVARRAKLIKDNVARDGGHEIQKPIPVAIEELLLESQGEGQHAE